MSRKTRVTKNVDPTMFEHTFDAVIALQATLNDTINKLQKDVIEFSVCYAALVNEGKRLDEANKNDECKTRLIAQFGNDYENKGTRCRYMSIAAKADVFRAPEILASLPREGRDTLYQLSRLDAPQIKSLVASGQITPDLTVKETRALVKDTLPVKEAKKSKEESAIKESASNLYDSVAITLHFTTVDAAVNALREAIETRAADRWSCDNAKDSAAFAQLLKRTSTRAAA